MIIGDTPQQLGQIEAADAMLIDGEIVTRDDYRALVARVEALRAGLNQAIELLATALVEPQQITEAEIYDLRQIEQAAPQQHLAERDAQKGRDGFIAGVEARRIALLNDEQVAIKANQYADSIRRGEVGK